MTIKEAIYERHTVRKYTGKAIPAETAALLNSRNKTIVTKKNPGTGSIQVPEKIF